MTCASPSTSLISNTWATALNQFQPKLRNGTPVHLDGHAFGGEFVTYFTSVGVLQIINRYHGFDNFRQLIVESPAMNLKGLSVHVASLDALEKMKTGTGRDRDQIHLDIIRALKNSRKE